MQSLRRGIAVIESIKSQEPCGLHQIHQDTGLPKPTLLRILDTLESLGVVFRPIDDKRYRLGANSILAASKERDIRALLQEVSVPILMNLCKDIAWPSDLVIPDGNSMVVVASNRMLSPFPIKPTGHGHHPDMLLTAVGRIFLAISKNEVREEILEEIRKEQPDHPLLQNMASLRALLEESRAQEYGVRSEYKHDGFSAIAVPVLVEDQPIACLNLFFYRSAVSLENIVSDHLARLKEAAQAIAQSVTNRS